MRKKIYLESLQQVSKLQNENLVGFATHITYHITIIIITSWRHNQNQQTQTQTQTQGANPNNGLGAVLDSIEKKLPAEEAKLIKKDFDACYEDRPWLAMVNSDKGVTNLHVPSDVIIDASMPNVIRDSGQMWNNLDELEDTKCLIPDRCYATMHQEIISFVKTKGQFDVSTMGNVANYDIIIIL